MAFGATTQPTILVMKPQGRASLGLVQGALKKKGSSPGAASRKQLGSGHAGTETRWAGLRGVLVGVGLNCREPGA